MSDGTDHEAGRKGEELLELRGINKVLHDLCQPLTTLQCRLEMASVVGTDAAYREAVALGLAECTRLAVAVESLRELAQTQVLEDGLREN